MSNKTEKVTEKENQKLGRRFVKPSLRMDRKVINLEEIEA
jgi:hypothetical protein